MPNYYMTADQLTAELILSTQLQAESVTGMELKPYIVAFDDYQKQYQRSPDDLHPQLTAEYLFSQNQRSSLSKQAGLQAIIPTPASIEWLATEPLNLQSGIKIVSAKDFDISFIQPALARLQQLGVATQPQGVPLSFVKQAELHHGAYQLKIAPNGITILSSDEQGISYGLASLTSLLVPQTLTVNSANISDQPHYLYRGMHLDVARNFHNKATVFTLLDQMAALKLNKLHLHMADDEGWRLQIDGLAELTEIGSKRCHDLAENSCLLPQLGSGPQSNPEIDGFYSQQDYIDILQYAAARHIDILPSMDMPGHSRAAVKAMEARSRQLTAQGDEVGAAQYLLSESDDTTQYLSIQNYSDNTINVCLESSYVFIDKVINEIAKLHQQAGVPLTQYHIGADETAGAWLDSPACHQFIENNDFGVTDTSQLGAYFIERISQILNDKGIMVAGWSDGMSHTRLANMPAQVQSHVWENISAGGHKMVHKQANQGWQTVLSVPEVLYLDMPYGVSPKEHGYYWAARALDSYKIFSFMPDNLAANAEQWFDIEGQSFSLTDGVYKLDEQQQSSLLQANKVISGISAQLWSETIRSPQLVEYMTFPRLLMVAERAWHQADWQVPYQVAGADYNQTSNYFNAEARAMQAKQWQMLANGIGQKALYKLDIANIDYRLPVPGAVIKEGKLHMNVIFPGLQLQYRQPSSTWQHYVKPVTASGTIEVRSVSPLGQRFSRTIKVEME